MNNNMFANLSSAGSHVSYVVTSSGLRPSIPEAVSGLPIGEEIPVYSLEWVEVIAVPQSSKPVDQQGGIPAQD